MRFALIAGDNAWYELIAASRLAARAIARTWARSRLAVTRWKFIGDYSGADNGRPRDENRPVEPADPTKVKRSRLTIIVAMIIYHVRDATRRKPRGEREKESGVYLAVVSPRGQRVIITNWTVRIIAATALSGSLSQRAGQRRATVSRARKSRGQ